METGITILPRVQACSPGIDALKSFPSSIISDACGRQLGAQGLLPIHRSSVTVCGNALTVKVRSGDNLMIYVALEMLQPGDVLLVDGEGDLSRALVGEIIMLLAKSRGAFAFVIDGAVRDSSCFDTHGFGCWARGVSLRGPFKEGPGAVNIPISLGGMTVCPGDIIVADQDGVVAVSPAHWQAVAQGAEGRRFMEEAFIQSITENRFDSSWVYELMKRKGVNIPKS